jgi:H+/gluconate symporter-like permease
MICRRTVIMLVFGTLSLSLLGQARQDSTILVQKSGAEAHRSGQGAGNLADSSPPGLGSSPRGSLTGSDSTTTQVEAHVRVSSSQIHSLLTLAVGVMIVLVGIIGFKLNAFLALIMAALVVSLMSGGPWSEKIVRVGAEFGASAGRLGLVIALAAVIGQSFLASGCAERVVNFFVSLLGERRTPVALCGSGYLLGIPVFFDTVFYLLVPLARSAYLRTRTRYLACLLAVTAGGVVTHTLVPPTPGPLLVASNLGVNLGTMMMVGSLIGVVAAAAGLAFAFAADRWIPIPIRWLDDPNTDAEAKHTHPAASLPPLGLAILPLGLPVALIAGATILTTWADQEAKAKFDLQQPSQWRALQEAIQFPASELTEDALRGLGQDSQPTDRLVDEQSVLAARRVLKHVAARLVSSTEHSKVAEPQPAARSAVEEPQRTREAGGPDTDLAAALNRLLDRRDFYDREIFLGVRLSATTQKLLAENRTRLPLSQVQRLNRLLLEDALLGLVEPHEWETPLRQAATWVGIFGDANLALLLAAVVALLIEKRQRQVSWAILGGEVEKALASAGVIILITAAGGAFGAMLNVAQVGDAIRDIFSQYSQSGLGLLVLAFAVSSLLKFAQGSSTVAMITASGMLASMASPDVLGCHPVYMATAIGGGSLFGSWMNDSGFWIFAKMGYLTTEESLKTWTPCLAIVGFTGGVMSVLLAWLLPLV